MQDDVCAVRRSGLCAQRDSEVAGLFGGECQVPIAQGARAVEETAEAGAKRRNREGGSRIAGFRCQRSGRTTISAWYGAYRELAGPAAEMWRPKYMKS